MNKKIILSLSFLFITSCTANDKNLAITNLLKNTNTSDKKSNQGPNSTGGLFRLTDKEGKPLNNTKFKVFSQKEDNLNPLLETTTDNKGEALISNETITPEIIKNLKENNIKIVLKAYKDGLEIPLAINNIEFKNDTLIEVSAKTEAPKALEVRLSQKALNLNVGKTSELSADVLMNDGSKTSGVTWSSSDETIATIINGKISALKKGVTIITASATSDLTVKNKLTLTVTDANSVATVKIIDPKTKNQLTEAITIKPLENIQLQAISVFTDGTTSSNIIWKSSDESIVAIGKNGGLATGVAKGKALITASSADDISKSSAIEIMVN